MVKKGLTVSVITEDKSSSEIECDAVISHFDREVLINDKLCDALGIVLLTPGSGIWRFIDEDRSRKSEPPQYW